MVEELVDRVADHAAHAAASAVLTLGLRGRAQTLQLIHIQLEGMPDHLAFDHPYGTDGRSGFLVRRNSLFWS